MCVRTPTVATEKDSAQLPKSYSSFTEGSSVDLEIVGSKCRLILAPLSPEKTKKSKYVRDRSKKTPPESSQSHSAKTTGAPNDRFRLNICSERYRFPRNFDTAKNPTNFEMAIPFI